MEGEQHTLHWQVAGQSVRGASHERSGLPNQDAIRWLPESGCGSSLVLALADGHGSTRYSRSHTGARLAVETAAQLTYDFLAGHASVENPSLTKRAAEEWLPGVLARAWLEAVDKHIRANPFTESELAALGLGAAADSISDKLPIAYGTTILAAAVSATFILYLQLGDGEILTVTADGTVSKPLSKDERLFANETTSLCAPEAWRDFRVSFQPIVGGHPALILLSTDGYPNSFRDESGFLQVGADILEMVYADGLGKVKDSLEGWLADSTRAGSGDDVTLGILCAARTTDQKEIAEAKKTARIRSR